METRATRRVRQQLEQNRTPPTSKEKEQKEKRKRGKARPQGRNVYPKSPRASRSLVFKKGKEEEATSRARHERQRGVHEARTGQTEAPLEGDAPGITVLKVYDAPRSTALYMPAGTWMIDGERAHTTD